MRTRPAFLCLAFICVALLHSAQADSSLDRLDTVAASKLAASLANKEARKNFDQEPFSASDNKPVLKDGQWRWHAIIGYGKSDLEANVSFAVDGSTPKVEVKQLINIDPIPKPRRDEAPMVVPKEK